VIMKGTGDVIPCSLVEVYHCFGVELLRVFSVASLFTCLPSLSFDPENGGIIFLQKAHVVYHTTQGLFSEDHTLQL
jgi:hypothetical protein